MHLCVVIHLPDEVEYAQGRWQLFADETVNDGPRFDHGVKFALDSYSRDQVNWCVGLEMDAVGVVARVVLDASLEDVGGLVRKETQVYLSQTSGGALGGGFLERDLQAELLAVFLCPELHVGDYLEAELERFRALVQFLAGEVKEAFVQSD